MNLISVIIKQQCRQSKTFCKLTKDPATLNELKFAKSLLLGTKVIKAVNLVSKKQHAQRFMKPEKYRGIVLFKCWTQGRPSSHRAISCEKERCIIQQLIQKLMNRLVVNPEGLNSNIFYQHFKMEWFLISKEMLFSGQKMCKID